MRPAFAIASIAHALNVPFQFQNDLSTGHEKRKEKLRPSPPTVITTYIHMIYRFPLINSLIHEYMSPPEPLNGHLSFDP